MVDITQFWSSLKVSWLRRLLKSKSFWPTILELDIEKLIGKYVSAINILQLGPNLLTSLGKQFNNKFWKHVFMAIRPLMQGAIFCNPENILLAPFWDNPNILRHNKQINASVFPSLSEKLKTMVDFYINGSDIFASKADLEDKFNVEVSEEDLMDFDYALNMWQNIKTWLATLDIILPLDRANVWYS